MKSHLWARYNGEPVACLKCWIRTGWPGADRPCQVDQMSQEGRAMVKLGYASVLTFEEVGDELRRASSHGEEGSFRVSHPGTTYGRDGRRRTGL